MSKNLTASMEEAVLQEVHICLNLPQHMNHKIVETFLSFFLCGCGWNNSLNATVGMMEKHNIGD